MNQEILIEIEHKGSQVIVKKCYAEDGTFYLVEIDGKSRHGKCTAEDVIAYLGNAMHMPIPSCVVVEMSNNELANALLNHVRSRDNGSRMYSNGAWDMMVEAGNRLLKWRP
jgi:hypothetical protein